MQLVGNLVGIVVDQLKNSTFPAAAAFNILGDISNVPNLTLPTDPAASKAFNAFHQKPAPRVRIVSYPPPNFAATAF